MQGIPASELGRFEAMVIGHAGRYGLSPRDYLRKVWYHEQAARFGEYVALRLVDELLPLAPLAPEVAAELAASLESTEGREK